MVATAFAMTSTGAGAATLRPVHAKDHVSSAPGRMAMATANCATSTDQTALVQELIDSAPDGTASDPTVIDLPPGICYTVDGTVTLDDRSNLVIEGDRSDPAVFDRPGTGTCVAASACHIFFLEGGANITFTGVDVVSDNFDHRYDAAYDGQAAWWVWGTQGLTLDGDGVGDVWGDFVTLGPDTYRSWKWADDVTISDDTFYGSGRQGIAITGAENVDISDDHIAQAALSSIDIEPDSGTGPPVDGIPTYGGAEDVTVADNTFGPSGTTFISNYGACATISDITVTANTLRGAPLVLWSKGCPAVHRTGWTITANTSDTPFASPRGAFEFTYVDGATVRDNSAPFYAPEQVTAVKVWGSSNVSVTDNDFPGASQVLEIDPPVWLGPLSQGISSSDNVTS